MTTKEVLLERRVVTESGCWEIRGQAHRRYGQLRRHGYVHRAAYEAWVGPIPAGMLVCHRCDNPPCYNPAHLYVGSRRDNLLDAAYRGQWKPSPHRDVCKNGHPMTGENVYCRKDRPNRRECVECRRAAGRRNKAGQSDRLDRDAAMALERVLG